MAVSDQKKCQSLINRAASDIEAMRAGMTRIKSYRNAYVSQSVDPTGTALEGNVSTLNTAINDLDTLLNGAVFSALIAAKVPSHRGDALGV